MSLNYQDKSIITMYLQIFLKEYYGVTVEKSSTSEYGYSITTTRSINVTGVYNEQTYASLSLYMHYIYPNENYPYIWNLSDDKVSWIKGKSSQEILKESITEGMSEKEILEKSEESVLEVISTNLYNLNKYKGSIYVPDRVLSYIFNEVVTPESSPEEILRIKRLIYSNYQNTDISYEYDDKLFKDIVRIQSNFIQRHTIQGKVNLPARFEEFKVTGYVDPWTELLIRRGEI